jgi:cytochrome P450
MTDELRWDPYDRSLHASPYSTWKRLRDEQPVYRNEALGFVALSRFRDVLDASLDTQTFSSAHGITLDDIHPQEKPSPKPLIMMDPPEHTRMRRLVNRTFTPRRIAQLETRLRQLCAEYLDPHVGSDGFDYVRDFSMKLPVMVISSLLGFPEEDHDQLRMWSDLQLHRHQGSTDLTPEGAEAMGSLMAYYADQVADRRATPRDDMATDIVQAVLAEADGSTRPLDDGEILMYIAVINIAGNETVARLLGWAALTLDEYPDERRLLSDDHTRIAAGVEELLRYEAPSPVQGRYTTRDVALHGTTIPRGSKVLLLTGSAGRDEREYADADRYRVDRDHDRHVSFGHGAHFCLGAALARMESKVALEETLARFPEWGVERDEVDFVHTNSVRGPARVPITL